LDPDPERFSGSGSDMTKKFWIQQLPSDIALVKQIKILQLKKTLVRYTGVDRVAFSFLILGCGSGLLTSWSGICGMCLSILWLMRLASIPSLKP